MIEAYQGAKIIDSHIHMEASLKNPDKLIEYLDDNGVALGFLIASPLDKEHEKKTDEMNPFEKWYFKGPNNSRLGRLISRDVISKIGSERSVETLDNQGVSDSVRQHPDRLFAWLFAEPEDSVNQTLEGLDQIREMIKDPSLNVAGIKMHFWLFPTDIRDDRILHIVDLAKEAKKPVLIDVGVDRRRMRRFAELSEMYHEVPIFAAHLGSMMSEVLDAAWRHENVFVDTSGYTISGKNLRDVAFRLGPRKLIFGSDSPGSLGGNIQDSLRTLDNAALSPKADEMILWENVASIVPKAGELVVSKK